MSGASRPTVDKWLERYVQFGMEGLVSRTSPGGPRQIPERIRGRVLALTRTTPPSALGISHWSSTEMARYIKKTEGVYVSQTWVSRLWREHGLAPWRRKHSPGLRCVTVWGGSGRVATRRVVVRA